MPENKLILKGKIENGSDEYHQTLKNEGPHKYYLFSRKTKLSDSATTIKNWILPPVGTLTQL